MRGRKPLPTSLKVLRGCRPSRMNKNEPQPEAITPKMPEWLSPEAQQKWRELVAILSPAKILTVADGEGLAVLSMEWATMVKANAELEATGGLVVRSPGGQPIQNPNLAIRDKAAEKVHKLLVEYGLTPSSRSRVHAASPVQHFSAAEKFMREDEQNKRRKFFGGA